jgi:hypothetical protein
MIGDLETAWPALDRAARVEDTRGSGDLPPGQRA